LIPLHCKGKNEQGDVGNPVENSIYSLFLGLPLKFIKKEGIFVEGRRNAFKRGENSL